LLLGSDYLCPVGEGLQFIQSLPLDSFVNDRPLEVVPVPAIARVGAVGFPHLKSCLSLPSPDTLNKLHERVVVSLRHWDRVHLALLLHDGMKTNG